VVGISNVYLPVCLQDTECSASSSNIIYFYIREREK